MPDETKEEKRKRLLKRRKKRKKGVAPSEDKIREFLSHGRLKNREPGFDY